VKEKKAPLVEALFFLLYMGPSTKNVTTTIGVIVSTTIAPITITKSLELSRFFSLQQFKVGGVGEDHQTPHHHVDLCHFYGHGHHNKNNNAIITIFFIATNQGARWGRTIKPLIIMLIFIIFEVMNTT
jgi:hypothetical protein